MDEIENHNSEIGPPDRHRLIAKLPRLPNDSVRSVQLQSDRRNKPRDENSDRRRAARIQIETESTLSTLLQDCLIGILNNQSTTGCSIWIPYGDLQVDEVVWFKIDAVPAWKGIVRWVNERNVGVEFERPFYHSVFELIVQSHKTVALSRAA